MAVFLLFTLLLLPFATPKDPAAGLFRSRTAARNLECERITTEAGSQRYPGQVMQSAPRGDYIERSAVVCKERLMRPGVRPAQDEAMLSSLDATAAGFAATAAAVGPELEGHTWHVEVFYPSAQVANKIAFATKNALVHKGLQVSDRTPILAAGDIAVITRMAPAQAYATACERYFALGSLDTDDALLAIVSRDRRETTLHAGLCAQGKWRWLR